jgi:hypothetical protein
MLGNAYQDGKQVTARIRAAVRGIQASSGQPAPPLEEPALTTGSAHWSA